MGRKYRPTYRTITCSKCGAEERITCGRFYARRKQGNEKLCGNCIREQDWERINQNYPNATEEEKLKMLNSRAWFPKATPERRAAYSEKMRRIEEAKSPEEKERINKLNAEGVKRHWDSMTAEARVKRVKPMHDAENAWYRVMTAEERSERNRQMFKNLPDARRAELLELSRQRMVEYNASLPLEEKQRRVAIMNKVNLEKSAEERAEIYRKSHQWFHDLNAEEKEVISQAKRDYFASLPDDVREAQIKRRLTGGQGLNRLEKKFRHMFENSALSHDYWLAYQYITKKESRHCWDFAICRKDDGELAMLIDVDGCYHHADDRDYDGIHSKEEFDEQRVESIPDGIPWMIIQEKDLLNCFKYVMDIFGMSYQEYLDNIFKECRSIPFPQPSYSSASLIKSYQSLQRMKCDDKYHQDMSVNTRIGDQLIQHFHGSIWSAHRAGSISPHEAWYNDELLKKCIRNRTIYQTRLNPNKILQGFNVSKIAPKVSVFSAGRAKMIIHRYLAEYHTIFDPFSGFSGRMLGAVSLNKDYIGQDISEIHVRESNQIIDFLRTAGFHINAEVYAENVLNSYGTYDCLFTCPPYGDKEQWLEVPVDTRSCDDWIDICLEHFKCHRYVFVVDETKKYKEYIVDEIKNKSHLSKNSEWIIVIDK